MNPQKLFAALHLQDLVAVKLDIPIWKNHIILMQL